MERRQIQRAAARVAVLVVLAVSEERVQAGTAYSESSSCRLLGALVRMHATAHKMRIRGGKIGPEAHGSRWHKVARALAQQAHSGARNAHAVASSARRCATHGMRTQ
jgi:hypothetical protein